jgi:hypothetical protein
VAGDLDHATDALQDSRRQAQGGQVISEEHVEKAIDFIRDNAPVIAKARAHRVYLEEFRKSKKAILMRQFALTYKSMAEREAAAYAHQEYLDLLDAIKIAIEEEERLRWLMVGAQVKIEVWRSEQANRRAA